MTALQVTTMEGFQTGSVVLEIFLPGIEEVLEPQGVGPDSMMMMMRIYLGVVVAVSRQKIVGLVTREEVGMIG